MSQSEETIEKTAQEFVKWCFSFGHDFRNSPDVTNFRSWTHKHGHTLSGDEERRIQVTAAALFAKRLEQSLRKDPGTQQQLELT